MSVGCAPKTPSPLAGEGGPERSEGPGEGWGGPVRCRGAAVADPSPASLTLRVRSAPSPARGEGVSARVARKAPVAAGAQGRARALRSRLTQAERKLWYALRDRRFSEFKFRRQVPVAPFIADFVCFEARLVIELDGGQHADSLGDKQRDRWFAVNGFRVLRFWNNDVLSNLEGVMTLLAQALKVQWS
jgi:very-short-patch-repair endonuclease